MTSMFMRDTDSYAYVSGSTCWSWYHWRSAGLIRDCCEGQLDSMYEIAVAIGMMPACPRSHSPFMAYVRQLLVRGRTTLSTGVARFVFHLSAVAAGTFDLSSMYAPESGARKKLPWSSGMMPVEPLALQRKTWSLVRSIASVTGASMSGALPVSTSVAAA